MPARSPRTCRSTPTGSRSTSSRRPRRMRASPAASDAGLTSGFDFGPVNGTTWPFFLLAAAMLFQFIGFQYSAYISGEVRGNVTRGALTAVLGALVLAVLMNSIYAEMLPRRLGLDPN